jgi:hypothetical protein
MKGGITRASLLFLRRGQLMIDHGPISDFILKRLLHSDYFLRHISQLSYNGLISLKSTFYSRQWIAASKCVPHSGIDRAEFFGGLRY